MTATTNQTLIDRVLEWAAAGRDARRTRAEYMRISGSIGERLNFLDDHPGHQRSAIELEQDRELIAEEKKAGEKIMEAEARESQLLGVLRLAADAALPTDIEAK